MGESGGPCKPEVEYPCRWNYRIVGSDEALMRAAVVAVVGEAEHDLEPSHVSTSGRYLSLKVAVVVQDETQRVEVFHALRRAPAIRYVL